MRKVVDKNEIKVKNRLEGNIIIAINAAKSIMNIFLGPFLTAYFIKTSKEGVADLSVYYMLSFILLAIGSFVVASIVKSRFQVGMFRIGVVLNFIYILLIIILKENIVNHLLIASLLYGASMSVYWFPYNLFVINKIDNADRTEYTVKSKIVLSSVQILCPVLLGSIITVTNYTLTAIIVLFVSAIQIVLSFLLTPQKEMNLSKFNPMKTWKNLKGNKQIRRISIMEFLIGMNINDGALNVLMAILIVNSFRTDMNLGIITSATSVLSMIFVYLYGRIFKNRDDKKVIIVSSVVPILAVLLVLFWKNDATIIVYNVCFAVFTAILAVTREIRIFNVANSQIVDMDNQSEFFAIREGFLNLGRIFGYLLLLLAGISGSEGVFNTVMIILTLSILAMGLNIGKVNKFDR